MSLITEGIEKITKGKTKLVLKHPFFSIIALALIFKNAMEDGMASVKTMATDGKHVWWDENFVDAHSVLEICGVIAHEVLHVVFLHCLRRGTRNPLLWNIACDYAINHIVLDAGLILPPDALFEEKYRGWLVDAIYDDLLQNMPKVTGEFWVPGGEPSDQEGNQPGGQGNQPGQPGGKIKKPLWGTVTEPKNDDGSPMSEAEQTELAEDIKIRVIQAAEAAKSIGKLPMGIEALIKAIGKPTVNWKAYIQDWVSGKTPDDYTWKKPNRRMLGLYNMLAPSIQLNGAGVGVLSIDTSGSVSEAELKLYITEIVGVIEVCNPDKLYIIQHDAKINGVHEYEAGEIFDGLKITGRGGTRIAPSFKYAATKIDERIDWMICFTDMGINDYPVASEAPDFPVLWAATGPDNAPFGTYLPLRDALSAAS
jgi:predicted metal-dependent peptidase